MRNRTSETSAKQRRSVATAKYWQRTISLLSQRDQLIDEILLRSRAGAPAPLIKKAGTLLTRFWARADWKSREELLRAARWLLSSGSDTVGNGSAEGPRQESQSVQWGASFKSAPNRNAASELRAV